MQMTLKTAKKAVCLLATALLLVATLALSAAAAGYEDLDPGTYTVDAGLSCFVSAMGGIEFGAPLLTDATLKVNEDNSAALTLSLRKSSVTIYGVTCDTFIDPNFPIGYFDGSEWQTAAYTLSDDTALNAASEPVNYVDSMTFTLPNVSDAYALCVYVNSNVMGVQFGGVDARYDATLAVDWASCVQVKEADETSSQSATVNYTVTGGYEVKIPAVITVDSKTLKGAYTVEAVNFVIDDSAYVTVTADASGSLSNGKDTLAFDNELESGSLTATGDKLEGAVTVTEAASAPGAYTGTLDFTINYFAD